MESTGVPEKIQVSQQFKEEINKYYPEFLISLRGDIEIKAFSESIKLINFRFRAKESAQPTSWTANAASSKRLIPKRRMLSNSKSF
jgi:predicted butyrate kinase (DUF1464 family)